MGGAAAASGCGGKSCGLVGCLDSFGASVQRADGSFPSGMHRIEILADSTTFRCMFIYPLLIQGGAEVQPACDFGLFVSVLPETVCTDTSTGQRCDPIPGRFVETISLNSTPGQVHAWQYVDDVAILDAAAAPSYQDFYPNGPDCDPVPVCRHASASWTLQ
jgi:hypothetical protein